jgi:hypothetical protein
MSKYTLDEIKICQGMDFIYNDIACRMGIINEVDIKLYSSSVVCIYINSIPSWDKIKNTKLGLLLFS